MVKKIAEKWLRKFLIDYPSVFYLLGGDDDWCVRYFEGAVVEVFQQSVQLTAVGTRALSSSTNYAVANFGGN